MQRSCRCHRGTAARGCCCWLQTTGVPGRGEAGSSTSLRHGRQADSTVEVLQAQSYNASSGSMHGLNQSTHRLWVTRIQTLKSSPTMPANFSSDLSIIRAVAPP
eukprot:272622-Chlamydomonas_euryale.AAC.11